MNHNEKVPVLVRMLGNEHFHMPLESVNTGTLSFEEGTPKTSGLWADEGTLGGRESLASVNSGGLLLLRQSYTMLDGRIMPVAEAYCRPRREETRQVRGGQ